MNARAGGVTGARRNDHSGGSGSIPASALFFQSGRHAEVLELVKRFHYSRRWPANVQFVGSLHEPGGLFGDSGRALCGACFSIPPTRWSEPVLELSRLVRRDDAAGVPLTMLIKLSLARLKLRGADLVVSFADNTHGHHGGIYRAAGWNYDGFRPPRRDGVFIDGKFRPCRSCNSVYGTNSPDKLRTLLPDCDVVEHIDEGKHMYWRALGKRGKTKAARLGLKSVQYTK